MKILIVSLIAATAAISNLNAHCGTCSTDGGAESHHSDSHAACQNTALSGYFAIQKALASDDLTAAQAAANQLSGGIDASQCGIDGAACCAEVSGATEAIAEASDIAAARKAFLSFSNALIEQVESHPSKTAVYKMHCPMAFNNQGASWLQDNSNLRNPYYGSMMLTCGIQQAVYGETATGHDHSHHDHSGHNH